MPEQGAEAVIPMQFLHRLKHDLAEGNTRSALGHARYIVDHFCEGDEAAAAAPDGGVRAAVDDEQRERVAKALFDANCKRYAQPNMVTDWEEMRDTGGPVAWVWQYTDAVMAALRATPEPEREE